MAFQNEEDGPTEREVARCGHCEEPLSGPVMLASRCCDKGICTDCYNEYSANFDAEVRSE